MCDSRVLCVVQIFVFKDGQSKIKELNQSSSKDNEVVSGDTNNWKTFHECSHLEIPKSQCGVEVEFHNVTNLFEASDPVIS